MAEQRMVFPVVLGGYSPYSIVAYFSSEEAANRFAEIRNSDIRPGSDEYHVEGAAPVHDEVPEPVEVLRTFVELDSPTPVTPQERVEHCVPGIDVEQVACRVWMYRDSPGRKGIQAYGTDHDRVRKAMSERMARVIAEWDITDERRERERS